MRREYTMTSPEQLYPDRERVRSPYLSPKNNPNNQQGVYSSFKSPSHRQEDNFDKKYPTSSKYNPYQHVEYHPQAQYHSPEPSQAIEISELRLTISQLRSSLQTTSQNAQRLQEELFMQRSKNVELSEVRRRLEEQLSRMQFQLDRIGNYDALETRQTNIKLTNALRENTRLSQQVADLIDQMKALKNEQRRLMSECDALLKEKQILMSQNQSLLQKLQLLEGQVRQVKQEVAIHSQQSIRLNQNALPSRVNNLHTVRTYQASTINNSPRPIPTVHSRHSIELQQLPEEIDYQAENEKMLRDYQRLLEENQSMKDLYNNLYQPELKPTPIPQMNMQTFSNKAIAQQLSSQRGGHKNDNKGILLKTMQKRQLKQQMDEVRDEALGELTKIYNRAVEKANSQHKNCLKVFIHELVKNKQIYAQMAENYLKLRMAIMEETGLKLPEKYEEGALIGQREKMVLQMYKSVKDKSKSQKEVGTALAVFRLITLMVKAGGITPILSDNIKHSILKYVYKLAENQLINKDP